MKESFKNRLTDGCLEVDGGRGIRLWSALIPWLVFEGPHIRCITTPLPPSIRSSIPLSHFLSSLHLEWTNSVFHSTPLRDRGPHIYSSRETQGGGWKNIKKFFFKNARNPSHVQDVEPCEGQCEDERTDRSKSGEETARTADRALTTENNRRGWKGCTESWKVVTASKEICDEWNEVEKMNLLFPL